MNDFASKVENNKIILFSSWKQLPSICLDLSTSHEQVYFDGSQHFKMDYFSDNNLILAELRLGTLQVFLGSARNRERLDPNCFSVLLSTALHLFAKISKWSCFYIRYISFQKSAHLCKILPEVWVQEWCWECNNTMFSELQPRSFLWKTSLTTLVSILESSYSLPKTKLASGIW